jgi:hypothetical protein
MKTRRTLIALGPLLAAWALSSGVAFAQDAPVSDPPPVTTTTTTPPPEPIVTEPVTPAVTLPPVVQQPVTPLPEVEPTTSRRTETRRTTTRTTSAASRPAPRATRPAPAPAAAAPAPAEVPPAAPIAQEPAPPPAALPLPVTTEEAAEINPVARYWPLLIGGLAVFALALFLMRRRRRREEWVDRDEYVETYSDEPAILEPAPASFAPATAPVAAAAAPAMAFDRSEDRVTEEERIEERHEERFDAPVGTAAAAAAGSAIASNRFDQPTAEERLEEPAEAPDGFAPAAPVDGEDFGRSEAMPAAAAVGHVEQVSVGEPDPAAVAALAASSEPPVGRPWLEFLLRPLRAGTSTDSAVVQFELTVGNTGSLPAREVELSTFMFAAGSPQASDMENLLIEPSSDRAMTDDEIPAGGARRVEAVLAMPKETLAEQVLPVVVADARYRLPDGSIGRTTAAFEVGRVEGDALAPFPTDRSSGLLETVEARLHGDPQRD